MNDTFEKDIIKKCNVCQKIILCYQDINTTCEYCGWTQSAESGEREYESFLKISYPMLVPLSRAIEQYKAGKPFKATFEDFINGLYFYSEMLLKHNDIMHEVLFLQDDCICFGCENFEQHYKTREDFENYANIEGRLLKEIWNEVTFAGYMYCGEEE